MLLHFISSSSSNSLRLKRIANIWAAVTLGAIKIWRPRRARRGVFRVWGSFHSSLWWSEDVWPRACDLNSTSNSCMPHNKLTKTSMITTKTSTVKSEEEMLRCGQLKSSALCDKEAKLVECGSEWRVMTQSLSEPCAPHFPPLQRIGRAAALLGRDRGGGNAHSRVKEGLWMELEVWSFRHT